MATPRNTGQVDGSGAEKGPGGYDQEIDNDEATSQISESPSNQQNSKLVSRRDQSDPSVILQQEANNNSLDNAALLASRRSSFEEHKIKAVLKKREPASTLSTNSRVTERNRIMFRNTVRHEEDVVREPSVPTSSTHTNCENEEIDPKHRAAGSTATTSSCNNSKPRTVIHSSINVQNKVPQGEKVAKLPHNLVTTIVEGEAFIVARSGKKTLSKIKTGPTSTTGSGADTVRAGNMLRYLNLHRRNFLSKVQQQGGTVATSTNKTERERASTGQVEAGCSENAIRDQSSSNDDDEEIRPGAIRENGTFMNESSLSIHHEQDDSVVFNSVKTLSLGSPVVAELADDVEQRVRREIEKRWTLQNQNITEAVVIRPDDNIHNQRIAEDVVIRPSDNNNHNAGDEKISCLGILRTRIYLFLILFCILALALGLGLGIMVGNEKIPDNTKSATDDDDSQTFAKKRPSFSELVDWFGQNVTKDFSVFDNPLSAQHSAMNWLATLDKYVPPGTVSSTMLDKIYMQRYLIALLSFSMMGSAWNISFPFLTDDSVCNWNNASACADATECPNVVGVSCNDDFVVTAICLPNIGLRGSIYSEIGVLSSLKRIKFNGNNGIVGTLPTEIFHLTNLTSLGISSCGLTGTISSSIGNLTNLVFLDLSSQSLFTGIGGFDGRIPSEMSELSQLTYVNLWNNHITGPIPSEISELSQLTYLNLGHNFLTGNIPNEIGTLTNLDYLSLERNPFYSSIPSEIGLLSKLTSLYLNEASFQGTFPSELGRLAQLQELILWNNVLSGVLPTELGLLSSLRLCYLSNNKLNGTIPSELGYLSNLEYLYLDSNELSGIVPMELEDLHTYELYLMWNNFTGSLDEVFCDTNATGTTIIADCGVSQPELQCKCCVCCKDRGDPGGFVDLGDPCFFIAYHYCLNC